MYKVIIIGAGSIGTTKFSEYDSPDTENILTHAHSVYNNPDCELIGIVDKDFGKAYEAALKWKTKAYEHISHIKDQADIIIVATPTETHKQVLLECFDYNPKVVIAEKPFCMNSREAQEVMEAYKKKDVPIIVDYIRAFDNQINKLVEDIKLDKYGKVYSAICYYVRGTSHESCHAIELFNRIFGEFQKGIKFESFIQDNPNSTSYTVYMNYEGCLNVLLMPVDSRSAFNVFDIEIMTDKGKILLSEHGKFIEFYPRVPESTYGNYNTLSAFPETRIKTGLTINLMNVLNEAVNYVVPKFVLQPKCTAYHALKVHKILEQIRV